jgi:excisionase family DNA binding protein
MKTFKNLENKDIMTMDMVAEYLNLSKSTIYKWVMWKKIPCTRIGRRNRFIKKDIDQWIQNGEAFIMEDIPQFPKSLKFNN